MNFRKFIHDYRTGTNDYTTAEAAEFLDLELERVRHLVRIGMLKPVQGGGRGLNYYFAHDDLERLNEQLEPYR